jgi:hypothetical protein
MRKGVLIPVLVLVLVLLMGTRLYFDANDGSSGYELYMMEIEHSITYD